MRPLNPNGIRFLEIVGLLFCALLFMGPAQADQSQFINAKLETRELHGNLANAVDEIAAHASAPVWIAYAVDSVGRKDTSCCGEHNATDAQYLCEVCHLEQQRGETFVQKDQNPVIQLEQPDMVTILFRADRQQVMRIRLASSDCGLDASGLRVVWLTGVRPEESVALLTRFVLSDAAGQNLDDGLRGQALMAIAQHADASADTAFTQFVGPGQPTDLREKATFWLGVSRGKVGLALLEKMAETDPSPEIRQKVAFALFVSREPHATDDLIRMAKADSDSGVRGQALFWLAQKAGQKASNTITTAIDKDPDTEVKKKAVFALTQMPKNEGVPKLIEVAQSNKNPEVRKQAMFWLGQSHDPRALAFFEKILSQ